MSETENHGNDVAGDLQGKCTSSSGPGSEDDKVVAPAAPPFGGSPQFKPVYPKGVVLSLVLVSLMLSMLLVALDMVCLAV